MIIKRDDELMTNLYWFWYKYVHYKTKSLRGMPERFESQFNRMIAIFEVKYSDMSGRWNGQTKAEFEKNYKRVQDIVDKSVGDKDKAIALSQTQANRISDEFKAINRAMAAKALNQEHIFEVFFQRAYELGSVSKQEYREYKLEKLGI
jgi:uncharacterized protein YukE